MKKYILSLFIAALFITTSCARRVVVTQPAQQVTVVKTLPRGYKVVSINGKKYYKVKGRYYRKNRRGYVIVKI